VLCCVVLLEPPDVVCVELKAMVSELITFDVELDVVPTADVEIVVVLPVDELVLVELVALEVVEDEVVVLVVSAGQLLVTGLPVIVPKL
jgi:hypothetical protein